MNLISSILAWMNASGGVRHYKLIEDGYLVGIGVGGGGTEITAGEYAGLAALIADKPAPPEGYDYRLREDLQWQLFLLPEPEEDEGPLDPARALELICGTSSLTKTQAEAFGAKLAREERKEKSD